jgi:16S rRNA processing protein RimM
MRDRQKWIEAGAIVRPHGIAGEVIVDAKGDLVALLAVGAEVRLTTRAGGESFRKIAAVRLHQDRPIVRFEGVEGRDDAERLRSSIVWMDRETIGPLDEGRWFVQDILGLDVYTDEGEHLGTIADVLSTPANDVYVVSGDGHEILLPATSGVVKKVDFEAGRMLVHLIEGLR